MKEKPNLFGASLRDGKITGVLPSDEFLNSSPIWKLILYRIYQILPYLALISAMVSQCFAIVRYWGDTVIILEILGNLAALFVGVWCNGYPMLARKKFFKVAEHMQNYSILSSSVIEKHCRLKEVREKVIRNSRLVCYGVRTTLIFAFIFWMTSPFIIRYLEGDQETCNESGTNRTMTPKELLHSDGFDQFCFIMWIPLDARKYYLYILSFQAFIYVVSIKAMIALSQIMVYCYTLVAAEFQIIGVLVELVDEIEEVDEDGNVQVRPGFHLLEQTESIPALNYATLYMKEVVKLHQTILRTASEINIVQGRCIPGPLAGVMLLIITSLVQITLVPSLTPKFSLVIVAAGLQIFIFSFFGEQIYTESERIGKIAYGSRWYERSIEFKKLVYMIVIRAQSPCCWDIMSMLDVRITVFADVLGACYRMFMVLLQLESQ